MCKGSMNAFLGFTELAMTVESGQDTDDEYDIIDSRELSDLV